MLHRRCENGLSKASLAKLRTTLRIALQWAERREIVSRNVARVSELPADARPAISRRSMTAEQLRSFLEAANGTPLAAMWRTMVTLGIRPGEAAGLASDDIDMIGGIVVLIGDDIGIAGQIASERPGIVRSVRVQPPVLWRSGGTAVVLGHRRLADCSP